MQIEKWVRYRTKYKNRKRRNPKTNREIAVALLLIS